MAYQDPLLTSTRPRLVILKGSVALDASQVQALKSIFDVVEVHSAAAAKKMLDGAVGGIVICAPGDHLNIDGEPLPTAAATILERIGEGIGVVDANGALLWTDARFKVHDEPVRTQFVRLAREALELFNRPADQADLATRRQCKRFQFTSGTWHYELIVCPVSLDQAQDRVTTVVGVLWEITSARKLQSTIEAIDRVGTDLLRIEPASVNRMNMADRLKLLEQKIIRAVHEVLEFDNFEIRLLDRETGQLELVIAENISPLKIGEVIYARPEGNGISGHVASTGKSYLCTNVRNDPLYREGLDNAGSSLTVPLLLQERVIGTFNIESHRLNAFDENDRRFAEVFGRYVAAAMNILDLLVVERFTTNEQLTQNIVNELSAPLNDLSRQATALRDAASTESARRTAQDLLASVDSLKKRVELCAAGPRSILGAEQELHKQEIDPLLAGKRVLVADDEPAIRDTLASILRQKGADVTVCATGIETINALESSRQTGRPFDVVLSDIKMPDRNGYEVYRKAKEINSNTPVILMTGFGYDPHHCIVRASQEGLQSFLFKPFKASQLMDVLSRVLAPR
jgi:CheY-like chemotaxis protein